MGRVAVPDSSSESEMDGEEDEPLPPSDLGGVPWKEAVRIHALLKGKSEEELEALQGRAPGSDGDEDDDEDGDEDDDEDEDGSSEGQEAPLAPALTRSGPGMPPQGSRDALPTSMSPDSGTQQATDSGDSVPCAHSGQRPRGGGPIQTGSSVPSVSVNGTDRPRGLGFLEDSLAPKRQGLRSTSRPAGTCH